MILKYIALVNLILLSTNTYASSVRDCLISVLQVNIDSLSEIKMGSHKAQLGDLVDEKGNSIVRAVMKKDGFSQDHTSEILAYEVSEILELHAVPPTVKKVINDETFSVQQFVEHEYNYSEFLDEVKINRSANELRLLPTVQNNFSKVNIFNILIGDTDYSKAEHILVGEDGFVFAIDKGFAFNTSQILSNDFVRKTAYFFTQPEGQKFREQLLVKSKSLTDAVSKTYGESSQRATAFNARLKAILDIKPGIIEPKSFFNSLAEETISGHINLLFHKKGELSTELKRLNLELEESIYFKPGVGSPKMQEVTKSIYELLSVLARIDRSRLNNLPISAADIIEAKKLISKIHSEPQNLLNKLDSLINDTSHQNDQFINLR
ncbi:MAG: hypothetical protein A2504_10280 [Bdellovibrionales bacterium RIFOXYD12_FULL_39_22]|nr:MAG: hypothetical protein A2385_16895 [Bdellovibrionales bacterium RIFOXYB1_FULL_39_21]OFZ44133.1 MAG: hypothetical protein A2485_14345 [Bdellovibrionales bacterium RIFOXYC12_FULL_39_17]OFZ48633.1 MAG: hypothetical protein A2404_08100 [Bdellovibrionales bacterium RIFOXYC1_FULL_39_130]OFZ70810.1 MAG: hypothetical protein A2451_06515 [Bdellovibrionales bacterium RIFOXYC2_FULL_39_8]OFZ76747.1 MAG: hypothetical protein A2560_10390 [Bdellovibrionales bacterium RIFOXYD1_FULL_39_84]OFZ95050.1 MAG: